MILHNVGTLWALADERPNFGQKAQDELRNLAGQGIHQVQHHGENR